MTTEGSPVRDETDGELEQLSFEPAVSATGTDDDVERAAKGGDKTDSGADSSRSTTIRFRRRRPARTGVRRKLAATGVLLGALLAMGGGYSLLAGSSTAEDSTSASAADIAAGRQLYQTSCITCHGANLEGVRGNGPSLIGVGAAATYFQVSTGRMPVAAQGAYVQRKKPKFNDEETRQLAAYVESLGGGPALPTGTIRGSDSMIALGGKVYRLNCASCHGTTGKGAPLSAGKIAPSLNAATDLQIWTAMLSGPENMPVFSNNSITPSEKEAIVAYVQYLKATKDPGGNGIDRIGPVSEAIVIWTAGVGLIMIAILWIGARAR